MPASYPFNPWLDPVFCSTTNAQENSPTNKEPVQVEKKSVEQKPSFDEVRGVIVDHLQLCETHRLAGKRVDAEIKRHWPNVEDEEDAKQLREALSIPDGKDPPPNYGDTLVGIMTVVQDRFGHSSEKFVYDAMESLRRESLIFMDGEGSERLKDAVWRIRREGPPSVATPAASDALVQPSNANVRAVSTPSVESGATAASLSSDATTLNTDSTVAAGASSPARHSCDFRAVLWYGTDYQFTKTQAAIVQILWKARENGTPDVGMETLLEAVDAKSSRVVDIFRENPAWGTFIVDGKTKGAKRIADPPNS